MTTPTKFSDSQQQEAWRAYACAALQTVADPMEDHENLVRYAVHLADMMFAEEMKRSRG